MPLTISNIHDFSVVPRTNFWFVFLKQLSTQQYLVSITGKIYNGILANIPAKVWQLFKYSKEGW